MLWGDFLKLSKDLPLHCVLISGDLNYLFADLTTDVWSVLVDIIFQTLAIYDDRGSRKAVDDLVVRGLENVTFMKTFAAMLVQVMEKQLRFCFDTVCYRLLTWSCLLLGKSQFATISKNAFVRVASTQASLLRIIMESSFRMRRACKRFMFHLFSQVWLSTVNFAKFLTV